MPNDVDRQSEGSLAFLVRLTFRNASSKSRKLLFFSSYKTRVQNQEAKPSPSDYNPPDFLSYHVEDPRE